MLKNVLWKSQIDGVPLSSLNVHILCTEVFKESTPIAGVPLSCLNISVYRGLQREHPHCWGTTLLPQCICVQRSSKRTPPLLGYHSLASIYLCTEVFKESTPIAGAPLSCLNVSVYRGLQREHPHSCINVYICVQRSLSEHPKRPLGARLNTRSENSNHVTPMHGECVSHLLSLYILFICTRIPTTSSFTTINYTMDHIPHR